MEHEIKVSSLAFRFLFLPSMSHIFNPTEQSSHNISIMASSILVRRCASKVTTVKPPTQDAAADCKLLSSLPAELRTYIWELTLSVNSSTSSGDRVCITHVPKRQRTVLNLIATCRQIYDEAAAIFYDQNLLDLEPWDLSEMVKAIKDPRRLGGFRNLINHCPNPETIPRTLETAAQLPRLNSISFVFDFRKYPAMEWGWLHGNRLIDELRRKKFYIKCVVRELGESVKIVDFQLLDVAGGYRRGIFEAARERATDSILEFEKEINGVLPSRSMEQNGEVQLLVGDGG